MQKIITILVSLICFSVSAQSQINRTLEEAQEMYANARTVDDYRAAQKEFRAARYDVGYVESVHKQKIDRGIADCDRKINQLTDRLTVNGNSNTATLSFKSSGGTVNLSVSTNRTEVRTSQVPSWVTIESVTSASMSVSCSPNNSSSARSGNFYVHAGNKQVKVSISQAGKEFTLNIYKAEFSNNYFINGDQQVLVNYGEKLYASDVRYLCTRLNYRCLEQSFSKTLYIKLFAPDGTLLEMEGAPAGFFSSDEVTFLPGFDIVELKTCFGNNDESMFASGTYRYEIWIDGKCEYSTTLELRAGSNPNMTLWQMVLHPFGVLQGDQSTWTESYVTNTLTREFGCAPKTVGNFHLYYSSKYSSCYNKKYNGHRVSSGWIGESKTGVYDNHSYSVLYPKAEYTATEVINDAKAMVRELEGMGFKFEEKELDDDELYSVADYYSDFRYGATGFSVSVSVSDDDSNYQIFLWVSLK